MSNDKPLVVFTSFWDASRILKDKCVLFSQADKESSVFKADLIPGNHEAYSIALAQPGPEKLGVDKPFPRLDVFCPTWDILNDYKEEKKDNDKEAWESCVSRYQSLLKGRKSAIMDWLDSLHPSMIYILCCWENTSPKVKCHREIVYNALKSSKLTADRAYYVYRNGTE